MSRDYDFKSDDFKELSEAIGQLALVWNDLGMVLSDLFHAATKIPNGIAADAIWNSIKSDRTQREMIVSLVSLNVLGYKISKNLRKEILWCLGEIKKLEDLRNDAIHSPVLLDEKSNVIAWHHLGNERAKKLADKDLVSEFRWFYARVIILRQYCECLAKSLRFPNETLIARPTLPNRSM